jgi:Ca2+/H+ antiporter, TMEM165/GDT1 family
MREEWMAVELFAGLVGMNLLGWDYLGAMPVTQYCGSLIALVPGVTQGGAGSWAGFSQSLVAVTAAELGDKTFFITMILAMRHPRRWVFVGAYGALIAMTVLSVGFGQAAAQLPPNFVKIAAVILFLGFGLKLLYDAWRMEGAGDDDEEQAALRAVEEADRRLRGGALAIVVEAFSLTFLAEWGDRTQFTTVLLATTNGAFGVSLGGIIGHGICALLAVYSGQWVCQYLSERFLIAFGGTLFVIFALVEAWGLRG